MILFLLLCLDWAVAYESAPVLPEPEALAVYQKIVARHAQLEKYWLTLSGTLKTLEQSSNDPKPLETKIFLKVQDECYRKIALIEYAGLAHWVPYLQLWMGNDLYFAELQRVKAYPDDPFEVAKWQLHNVNSPSRRDDFQNFYLIRTHRETVLSAGFNFWRWSYFLMGSAKHLESIKKIDCKLGTFYFLNFASSASGLPIKAAVGDFTRTLVGSAHEGYLVYDGRLKAITAMNVHVVTDEGYHYLVTEKANYTQQDSLVCPAHRQSTRQLISAEGKAPRVPQVNQFSCDYDLAVVVHPAEVFTISSLGFDEPEGLKVYDKFRGLAAGVIVPPDDPPVPEASLAFDPAPTNWKSLFVGIGVVVLLGIANSSYYLLRRKKTDAFRIEDVTWTAD